MTAVKIPDNAYDVIVSVLEDEAQHVELETARVVAAVTSGRPT
jgi:hypothetical protein